MIGKTRTALTGIAVLVALCFLPAALVYAQVLPHQRVEDGAVSRNFREVQRWLFYLEYGRTVMDAEIDSIWLTIDSLAAHKDTLHARIDSMQTSRDTVFYAYDAGGGLSIASAEDDTISFDTEVREDAIFVHGDGKGAVACNSAGWYNVVYSVGLRNSGGSALGPVYTYLIKYNAGWAVISGSYAYGTVSASVNSAEQIGAEIDIELASGDSLAVIAYNGNIADAAVTIAHTARLRIEKLH